MTRASRSGWITVVDQGRSGIKVAVKDLFDVAGTPTTAGSAAVSATAVAADADAACLGALRTAMASGHARLIGKTNLHELAAGVSGINEWFGTPRNPCDAGAVPGGSSSGSAAVVGAGEVDVAFGTDTAGSIRIPAACCGVAGLVLTAGLVPLDGVWPLAPTLDRVGPLARHVAGLAAGFRLLVGADPCATGAAAGASAAPASGVLGRLRTSGPGGVLVANPVVERAIDAALAVSGFTVVDVVLPGWSEAAQAAMAILGAEANATFAGLAPAVRRGLGPDVAATLARGARVGHQALRQARSHAARWRERLDREVFSRVSALAAPVLGGPPPAIGPDAASALTVHWTAPVNLAGLPALVLPLPPPGPAFCRPGGPPMPTSLQLIGPAGSEVTLLDIGVRLEAAIATL